jgi:uncharacterized DUF497 family protein
VEIEFDPVKSDRNATERGLPFTAALEFDWQTAEVGPSEKHGEERRIAVGYLHDRIHVLIYMKRGPALRIVSLRKANEREVRKYEEARSLLD